MRELMLVSIGIYFIITAMMFIYLMYNLKILIGRRKEFIKADYKLEPGTFKQTGKTLLVNEAIAGDMMDGWIQSVNDKSMKTLWKIAFMFSCYALYCCTIWVLSEHLENNAIGIFYISLVPIIITVIGLIGKDIINFFKTISLFKNDFFKIKNSREIMSEVTAL